MDLKIFFLKNGDVSQELRSQLSGNEPPHSYISEIMSLQDLGELYVAGYGAVPDHCDYKGVHCRTLARGGGILTQLKFHLQLWRYLGEVDPAVVVVLHPWVPVVSIQKPRVPAVPAEATGFRALWVAKKMVCQARGKAPA